VTEQPLEWPVGDFDNIASWGPAPWRQLTPQQAAFKAEKLQKERQARSIKSNLEQRRVVEFSLEELRRSGNRLRSRKMTDGNGLTYFDGRIIMLEAVQQIMAERVASSSLAFLTAVSRQLR